MEANNVVSKASVQEENKSKLLLKQRRTKLCLICSFGKKIVIQGRMQHYIGGGTQLVAVN